MKIHNIIISLFWVGSITFLLLTSCGEKIRYYGHSYCEAEKLGQFVINCSEAANPKSDEEGEDLVAQCERTGRRIFCKTKRERAWFRRYGGEWDRISEPIHTRKVVEK